MLVLQCLNNQLIFILSVNVFQWCLGAKSNPTTPKCFSILYCPLITNHWEQGSWQVGLRLVELTLSNVLSEQIFLYKTIEQNDLHIPPKTPFTPIVNFLVNAKLWYIYIQLFFLYNLVCRINHLSMSLLSRKKIQKMNLLHSYKQTKWSIPFTQRCESFNRNDSKYKTLPFFAKQKKTHLCMRP